MANKANGQTAEKKIEEALAILNDLGLPRQQLNERSALTLLSLLGLRPMDKWADASDPLMGISSASTMERNMPQTPAKRCAVRRFISSCRQP
jgi:hypothetical protein